MQTRRPRPALAFFLVAAIFTQSLIPNPYSVSPNLKSLASPSAPLPNCTPNVVDYDIVYVRAPRNGANNNTVWPDTVRALLPEAAADLRRLHPDCTEEVLFPLPAHQALVDAPIGNGAVADPNISFDGQWVVFAYYHDQTDTNPQRCAGGGDCLSYKGADIYRLSLANGQVARLTQQEFTPNTGNGADFDCDQQYTNCPNIGVFNVGPAFVAQSDPAAPAIVFTSTRNNFIPPKPFNSHMRALQLFTMDWNGRNVDEIGHLNLGQALHPYQLADGRLMFTSWENQGIRDSRQFNLWFIGPDGTQWNSGSGFGEVAIGHHFMTQMSDGDIVVVRYYNLNNNGFGDLVRFPVDPAGADFEPTTGAGTYMPFQRPAQVDLTDWASSEFNLAEDMPAPCAVGGDMYNQRNITCPGGNATRTGKVTQPAVAPGDDLLLVYSAGPAHHNSLNVNVPFYDGGLYLMPAALAANGNAGPGDLQRILNDPAYNEQWPRPVVAFSEIFAGQTQPALWPALSNSGSPEHNLAANSPFGLIGSSSLTWRDTDPRPGQYGGDPDPFNASYEFLYNWVHQGADAGLYSQDDIYAVRILALIPSTDRSYPNSGIGFNNYAVERMRILGEIAVRHEGVIDGNGYTDTSFLARLPADTPFTFQALDRNGMVLSMAQTWHQLRPGEVRYDCGGCHAHTKAPLDFDSTVAGQPGFAPINLGLQTPLLQIAGLNGSPTTTILNVTQTTVEYVRDIQPILTQRCSGCHLNDTSDGSLNLHADSTAGCWGGSLGTYYRLVEDGNFDTSCDFGLGTPAGTPSYFLGPQMTRYIRGLQSRQSLLIWKVFGARLDGRTNAARAGDIDYDPASDTVHPNLGTTRGLTWAERLTLARWVDLGAPIETDEYWGWFEDDLRPTLWAAPTVTEAKLGPVSSLVVSVYDMESGLQAGSFSVTFDVAIGGQPAGTNFAAGLNPANGGILTVPLPAAVDLGALGATMTVRISDGAGHLTEIVRTFSPAQGPIYSRFLPLLNR